MPLAPSKSRSTAPPPAGGVHLDSHERALPDTMAGAQYRKELSVVVPVYNEEQNISPLLDALVPVLEALAKSFEIIIVNDGSSDRTESVLRAEAGRHGLKVINFRRNCGQTAALMAGIDHASGETIIFIDADLQNDPQDIPLLLNKLEQGFDVACGWRKDRQDAAIRRNFVSRVANRLISAISGVRLHDYGCTLKAFRSDIIKGVRLYGEMHRFIPIYASWMGARVAELPVRHHPRRFGESKYGLERIFKVVLDLIVVRFLDRHLVKPIYVFGGFGIISLVVSLASVAYMIFLKFFEGLSMIQTPMPIIAAMFFLVGVVSILLGLIAEILVRTYFESQQRSIYLIRDLINFED